MQDITEELPAIIDAKLACHVNERLVILRQELLAHITILCSWDCLTILIHETFQWAFLTASVLCLWYSINPYCVHFATIRSNDNLTNTQTIAKQYKTKSSRRLALWELLKVISIFFKCTTTQCHQEIVNSLNMLRHWWQYSNDECYFWGNADRNCDSKN